MILRAIERVSPVERYGRPWTQLTFKEQVELLGYADLRLHEEAYVPEE